MNDNNVNFINNNSQNNDVVSNGGNNQNSNNNKLLIFVIIVLSISLLAASSYIVWDIFLNNKTEDFREEIKDDDNENSRDEVDQEIDFDMNEAEAIIKSFQLYLGEESLDESLKFEITLDHLNKSEFEVKSCDEIFENYQAEGMIKNEYSYEDENGYECGGNVLTISYEKFNDMYKNIFGGTSDFSKELYSFNIGSHGGYRYVKTHGIFVNLDNQAGVYARDAFGQNIYQIESAKLNKNVLTIKVNHLSLIYDDVYKGTCVLYKNFIANKGEIIDKINCRDIQDQSKKDSFINKNIDYIKISYYVFEKKNDNFVLKDIYN